MPARLKIKLAEVSQDALGFLLVYARSYSGNREGDPVCDAAGDPIYYKTRAAAKRAEAEFNSRETN